MRLKSDFLEKITLDPTFYVVYNNIRIDERRSL